MTIERIEIGEIERVKADKIELVKMGEIWGPGENPLHLSFKVTRPKSKEAKAFDLLYGPILTVHVRNTTKPYLIKFLEDNNIGHVELKTRVKVCSSMEALKEVAKTAKDPSISFFER